MSAYAQATQSLPHHWSSPEDWRRLLELFLLEKAAYEIGYEAANRPSWLGVPLRGLAALVEQLLPAWPTKTEA
jgi:maltose alpha-D-glucosyltransferase/alpha-amylase